MKTFSKITLILLVLSLTCGCKKNLDSPPVSQTGQSPIHICKVEKRIHSFIDKMNNPTKTSSQYGVDSTVWYIEATLNYTYSIWDSSFGVQIFDSSFISISLNRNNQVDDSDVTDAYNELEDSLGVHWDNISGTTKHLIATDVSLVSNSNGRIVLRLVSAIGSGSREGNYAAFGSDDHWIWGWELGGCGPNTATTSDAEEELEYKYLNPILATVPAYRVYFTNVEIHEYVVPGEYIDQNSPSGYRLFEYTQSTEITIEPCLDDDELNYYLTSNGIDYIVDDLEPTGYGLTTLDIIEDIVPGAPDIYGRRHSLDIWYGEIDYTTTTPSPL